MFTARRPAIAPVFVAIAVAVAALGALLAPPRPVAAQATTMDATILAGPGWEYEPLTYAPAGSSIGVDGEPVNGFVPVTYDGVSGWADASVVGWDATAAQEAAPAPAAAAPVDQAPVVAASVEPAPAPEAAPVDAAVSAEPAASEAAASEEAPRGRRGDNPDDLAPPRGDAITHAADTGAYTEEEILGIIREAAATHGQSAQAMIRVARCESGLNPSAVGGGGAYFGLFQFVPSTFEATPYGDGDIFDPWANANAAGWMWAEGRKGEWVCQ